MVRFHTAQLIFGPWRGRPTWPPSADKDAKLTSSVPGHTTTTGGVTHPAHRLEGPTLKGMSVLDDDFGTLIEGNGEMLSFSLVLREKNEMVFGA